MISCLQEQVDYSLASLLTQRPDPAEEQVIVPERHPMQTDQRPWLLVSGKTASNDEGFKSAALGNSHHEAYWVEHEIRDCYASHCASVLADHVSILRKYPFPTLPCHIALVHSDMQLYQAEMFQQTNERRQC